MLLFSWSKNLGPLGENVGEREELEFPESGVALKARFKGLFEDARVRVMREGVVNFALLAAPDRSESLTPVRRGVCAGDREGSRERIVELTAGGADCGGLRAERWWSGVVVIRRHGDCELCRALSEPWELVRVRNLEGDRDIDLRRLRTAVGSI